MKPDDRNGKLPLAKRPFRVLLIAGSDRRQYNCPGVDSNSENQAEHLPERSPVMAQFDAWADRFAAHVATKGKVPPGRYRAFGYKPPGHRLRDIRLGWRDVRMRLGMPRRGSSPQKQQEAGLNEDRTLHPKRSTREQPSLK